MTEKKHEEYHEEKIKEALHKFFSENGKKGGKIGGATTKRKYGYEHYRKLGLHMNEVIKAKRAKAIDK